MGQEKGNRMWAQPSPVLKLRQSFRVTFECREGGRRSVPHMDPSLVAGYIWGRCLTLGRAAPLCPGHSQRGTQTQPAAGRAQAAGDLKACPGRWGLGGITVL